jgi:hypothetical protein
MTVPAVPFTDEIIRRIAMEIGKEVVAHIEHGYPQMIAAYPNAKISIRNATYNAVMMHIRAADEGRTDALIQSQEAHRRKMAKLRKAAQEPTP